MENVVKQTNEMPEEIWAWKGFQDNGSWDKEPCSCCISHKYTRTDTINQWQPIETAPKDRTRILVSDGYYVDTAYFNNGEWCLYECGDDWYSTSISPSHWMPLPDAPKDGV